MEYIIAGAVIVAVAVMVATAFKGRKKRPVEVKEHLDKIFNLMKDNVHLSHLPMIFDKGDETLEYKVAELQKQVDHLSTVQLLTLDHLSLEHQIEPERDVLAKKTKERG